MNLRDNRLTTFLTEIHVSYGSANPDAAKEVAHLEFKRVAHAFEANIEQADGPIKLLYAVLGAEHMEATRLVIFTDVYLPFGLKGADYHDPDVKRRVDEEVERRMKEAWVRPDLLPVADSKVAVLLQNPRTQRQIRMMLLSWISATWTAFEILAGDAWQMALNSRPDLIAQEVLTQLFPIGSPEGLSAKGIPLWMAAKYGFDLRNHVGDMLKPRIDFSDIKMIQKAYCAAFGKDTPLQSSLADKNLFVLAATRHLVVHRGGIVDEKYNKIAGQNFTVNEELPLEDSAFLSNILGVGVAAGRTLIAFIDGWLCANPAAKSDHTEQTA